MKKLLVMLFALAAFAACSSDNDSSSNSDDSRPAVLTSGRTVLVYMAAENSLSPHVANSLEQMKIGSRIIGSGNTLLVYVDRSESRELPWLARLSDGKVTDSVSMYVPQDESKGSYARYNQTIRQMQWYSAVGWGE